MLLSACILQPYSMHRCSCQKWLLQRDLESYLVTFWFTGQYVESLLR